MKSIKIIGIAVAALGVAASVGGAIALYQSTAANVEFTIGAGTHTETSGNVTYKINNQTSPTITPKFVTTDGSDETGTGLSPTYTQVKYTFPLSAAYSSDVATPICTVGKLHVSLTGVPSSYYENLTVWAGVFGYEASSLGEHYYANVFGGDQVIEEDAETYVKDADISIASAGGQSLVVYLKYTVPSNTDMYTLDEASLGYTLSVTWGAPSDGFTKAYVVSNKTAFQTDDAYMMAPNVGRAYSQGWEWVGAVKAAEDLTLAKCYGGEGNKWSYGENTTLTSGHTYDVYWNGGDQQGDTASFADRAAPAQP